MGLQRYKEKRNFRATPEPAGKVARRAARSSRFVIQKHDATRLHYDFRLELEGVLKSWAVPKGIPTSKGDKRLAMHVEDHPLDYGDFEGVIPEGNYGAGNVMVWDTGTWEPVEGDALRNLRAGKLKLVLHGQKLEGEWTLVRMRARSEASGKDEWLLIKTDSDTKPIPAKLDDQSVLTQRTMAQIAGQRTRTWQSNRADAKATSFKARIAEAARRIATNTNLAAQVNPRERVRNAVKRTKTKRTGDDSEGEPARDSGAQRPATDSGLKHCPAEPPRFIEPMKAKLAEALPRGDWESELKHDGFRIIAVKNGAAVDLYSRNHRSLTTAFAHVAAAIRKLAPTKLVLDGEVVALNTEGHSSFQLLQNRETVFDAGTIVFYAFDLLNLDGRNTRALPLRQRRELLQRVIARATDPLRYSPTLNGTPEIVLAEVRRLGLEGIIAKQPDSKYESGQRSGAWIKLKCVNVQEFVVGGYTPPKGSRDFFGALLVGYYEKGKLIFTSKVGSGYTQKTLRELHRDFQPLRRSTCPFVNLPTKRSGKFGQGVSASEMKRCTWLEPRFVAQVRFTEWTSDGGLRHPVFLGLRDDKPAPAVTREA